MDDFQGWRWHFVHGDGDAVVVLDNRPAIDRARAEDSLGPQLYVAVIPFAVIHELESDTYRSEL
jgi:hypothetical protein